MQSTKSSQLEKKVEGFCLIIAPLNYLPLPLSFGKMANMELNRLP